MEQYGQRYVIPDDQELEGNRRGTHRIEDTIIADAGTVSNAVDLRGYGLVGLVLPTLTNCNLTFTASEAVGGVYATVYDNAGAAVTIAAGVGDMAIATDDLAFLSAYRWVKIVSSAPQGAKRTLHFIVKA